MMCCDHTEDLHRCTSVSIIKRQYLSSRIMQYIVPHDTWQDRVIHICVFIMLAGIACTSQSGIQYIWGGATQFRMWHVPLKGISDTYFSEKKFKRELSIQQLLILIDNTSRMFWSRFSQTQNTKKREILELVGSQPWTFKRSRFHNIMSFNMQLGGFKCHILIILMQKSVWSWVVNQILVSPLKATGWYWHYLPTTRWLTSLKHVHYTICVF